MTPFKNVKCRLIICLAVPAFVWILFHYGSVNWYGQKQDGQKQDGQKQDGQKQDKEKQEKQKQDKQKQDKEKKEKQKQEKQKKARDGFLAAIPKNLAQSPVTDEETCQCQRLPKTSVSPLTNDTKTIKATNNSQESTCDRFATLRGTYQNVASFSVYGQISGAYFKGIKLNAEFISLLYPDWVMRVYHAIDTSDSKKLAQLCDLWCKYPHLDFCQVAVLPKPLQDQSKIYGLMWRFFVLGDPLVERFIVRDLDSLPSQREVSAVNQWIQSNLTWHFMHDHPNHNAPIMGGMWGGTNTDLKQTTFIQQQLIQRFNLLNHYTKGTDQELLAECVLPVAQQTSDYINHNSYTCTDESYLNSTAWPTKRNSDLNFVGAATLRGGAPHMVKKQCPKQCRPPNHPEWTYC